VLLCGVLGAAAVVAGCRNDMQRGPRYDPLTPSEFFADGAASRPLVEGTVARGQLRADPIFHTGKLNGTLVDQMPVEVTPALLARGRQRFDVYCAPCHSRTGDGRGMVVQRGLKQPPSYHAPRLYNVGDGYLFDVITSGFGQMQDYSAQIAPADRWAIVAYIRVLQLSQRASIGDVPAADRSRLDTAQPPPGAAQGGTVRHD
jgi:mono/diheme cytochrome c family protein